MKLSNKEQALQIAKTLAPDLQNKIIYKVTDENPVQSSNKEKDSWYIIYSSLDKHCAIPSSKSNVIALSKETGEITFKGSV